MGILHRALPGLAVTLMLTAAAVPAEADAAYQILLPEPVCQIAKCEFPDCPVNVWDCLCPPLCSGTVFLIGGPDAAVAGGDPCPIPILCISQCPWDILECVCPPLCAKTMMRVGA